MIFHDLTLFLNLGIGLSIIFFTIKIYTLYRRPYLFWLILSTFFLPLIFAYRLSESFFETYTTGIIFYPLAVIGIELTLIMSAKKLASSLIYEKQEKDLIFLKDDIAAVRVYGEMANRSLGKIVPVIGTEDVKRVLAKCSERNPIFKGCYIDQNEKIDFSSVERNLFEISKENRMRDISKAFFEIDASLVNLYSALVPWEESTQHLTNNVVDTVNKLTILYQWCLPIILFKTVLEPALKHCKSEDIAAIKDSLQNTDTGIAILNDGTIDVRRFYDKMIPSGEPSVTVTAFLETMRLLYPSLQKVIGTEKAATVITNNFRSLPITIKETLYKNGLVEELPGGILEEEKITVLSRETLIRELTDKRKELENAYKDLAEAELDKIKSHFVDVVAHELKTPLTSIKTYIDLLRKGKLGTIAPLQQEKLEIVSHHIEQLTGLIKDMLEIPSIDIKELELRKETINMKEMIMEIIHSLHDVAQEKEQTIAAILPDSPLTQGDKALLEKAFKNVLVNAINYSPNGQQITIKGSLQKNKLQITVIDNGVGIPKTELQRIFNPFYTLGNPNKKEGMGLGLTIAKKIIESHDGEIWVESTIGRGSTFYITLPIGHQHG